MNEIKTDLFPDRLRAAKNRDKEAMKAESRNSAMSAESLPESAQQEEDKSGDMQG